MKAQCKETVYSGKWGLNKSRCMNGTLDNSEFCATHDPVRKAAREEVKNIARQKELGRVTNKYNDAENLQKMFDDIAEKYQPRIDGFYTDHRGKRQQVIGNRFRVTFTLSPDEIEVLADLIRGHGRLSS